MIVSRFTGWASPAVAAVAAPPAAPAGRYVQVGFAHLHARALEQIFAKCGVRGGEAFLHQALPNAGGELIELALALRLDVDDTHQIHRILAAQHGREIAGLRRRKRGIQHRGVVAVTRLLTFADPADHAAAIAAGLVLRILARDFAEMRHVGTELARLRQCLLAAFHRIRPNLFAGTGRHLDLHHRHASPRRHDVVRDVRVVMRTHVLVADLDGLLLRAQGALQILVGQHLIEQMPNLHIVFERVLMRRGDQGLAQHHVVEQGPPLHDVLILPGRLAATPVHLGDEHVGGDVAIADLGDPGRGCGAPATGPAAREPPAGKQSDQQRDQEIAEFLAHRASMVESREWLEGSGQVASAQGSPGTACVAWAIGVVSKPSANKTGVTRSTSEAALSPP